MTRQKGQRIPTITGKGWGGEVDKEVKGHRQFQESGRRVREDRGQGLVTGTGRWEGRRRDGGV